MPPHTHDGFVYVTGIEDRPLSQDELFEFGCRVSEIADDEAVVTSLPGDPMTPSLWANVAGTS